MRQPERHLLSGRWRLVSLDAYFTAMATPPPELSTDRTTVFVYGTLKRGGSNHALLAGQKYVGEARTLPGYCLYELDGYPGMIADTAERNRVEGEIWEVDAECLAALDELEGVSDGLYRRAIVPLGPPHDVWHVEAYLYDRSVTGRRRLGSNWPIA